MIVTLLGIIVVVHPTISLFVAVSTMALQLFRLSNRGFPVSTIMFAKFEQKQKALFSILVTLYGIVRDAKLLQSSNAPFSMLVTLLGMVTDCML